MDKSGMKDIILEKAPTESPIGTYTRHEDVPINTNKLLISAKKVWNVLSSYLIVGLIAALIGIAIGVKVSQKFYHDKMVDCTLSQGLVFGGKPYTLMPK